MIYADRTGRVGHGGQLVTILSFLADFRDDADDGHSSDLLHHNFLMIRNSSAVPTLSTVYITNSSRFSALKFVYIYFIHCLWPCYPGQGCSESSVYPRNTGTKQQYTLDESAVHHSVLVLANRQSRVVNPPTWMFVGSERKTENSKMQTQQAYDGIWDAGALWLHTSEPTCTPFLCTNMY